MSKSKSEYKKAVEWIKSGKRIVQVNPNFVRKIERILSIKLKKLSAMKYLVVTEGPNCS